MTPHDSTRCELDAVEALEEIEILEDVARMTGEISDEVVALRAKMDFARLYEESGQRVRLGYLAKIEALEAELASLRATPAEGGHESCDIGKDPWSGEAYHVCRTTPPRSPATVTEEVVREVERILIDSDTSEYTRNRVVAFLTGGRDAE